MGEGGQRGGGKEGERVEGREMRQLQTRKKSKPVFLGHQESRAGPQGAWVEVDTEDFEILPSCKDRVSSYQVIPEQVVCFNCLCLLWGFKPLSPAL